MKYSPGSALDCAALHTGKDLAVSPPWLPMKLFLIFQSGIRLLSLSASLLAPLQLLATGVTRYLALPLLIGVFGLSSPTLASRGDHHALVLYNKLTLPATHPSTSLLYPLECDYWQQNRQASQSHNEQAFPMQTVQGMFSETGMTQHE